MITPRGNLLKTFRYERPNWILLTGHCDLYNRPSREAIDSALAMMFRVYSSVDTLASCGSTCRMPRATASP